MEETNNPVDPNHQPKSSNKTPLIIGSIVGALALGVGGYFLVFNKAEKVDLNSRLDSLKMKRDSIKLAEKKDSLNMPMDYEDEYMSYEEQVIIAKEITFPTGQKLKFGDRVFVDYQKSTTNEKVVYLNNPYKNPGTLEHPIKINASNLMNEYSFEDYKKYFSIAPYSELPASVKKVLLNENNKYKNNATYIMTQNAQRAKSSLAIGDFDSDGSTDYAVIMDNVEGSQESRLVIVSVNKVSNEAYVSYTEYYNDRLIINSYKKGSLIYMNTRELVKAPHDGIILQNPHGKLSVIYDSKAQKYIEYSQKPTYTYDEYEDEYEFEA
ncbi:hypothetical protein AB4865_09120 [Capnocytophaga sp. ARDL2]|uniref:hypothetical protein n=1 Tax=Capnocytophaga sp. ARDL2 TaxID=3238809 RepID=UPI0035578662